MTTPLSMPVLNKPSAESTLESPNESAINAAKSAPSPRRRFKVKLLRADKTTLDEFEVVENSNLWVFIRKRRHAIGASCSGVGVCGACHVQVESAPEGLSPFTDFEKQTLERNGRALTQRLACLCRVQADVTISAEYW